MGGLEAIFRWMHIFAGIIWIGHLYFFNWVNGPLQAKLDEAMKRIRTRVPEPEFERAWAAGQAMTLADIVAFLLT